MANQNRSCHSNTLKPTFAEEKRLLAQGYEFVAGIDEVGRGALAGPVFAAAVIMPPRVSGAWRSEVRDSKMLTPAKRESLSAHIRETALSVGIGSVSHTVIDAEGIVPATRQAMRLAISQLSPAAQFLLIDYFQLPGVTTPQGGVPEGDGSCFSIAAASIVAKVARDALMVELSQTYPGYHWEENKGYSTEEHLACLRRLGPSPVHRRTFEQVRDICDRLL